MDHRRSILPFVKRSWLAVLVVLGGFFLVNARAEVAVRQCEDSSFLLLRKESLIDGLVSKDSVSVILKGEVVVNCTGGYHYEFSPSRNHKDDDSYIHMDLTTPDPGSCFPSFDTLPVKEKIRIPLNKSGLMINESIVCALPEISSH